MDEAEDPLGKISRQLSELAASSSSSLPLGLDPETVNPTIDNTNVPWTQFGGFHSSQPSPSPTFNNLYSWPSAEVPRFEPLVPPNQRSDFSIHHNQRSLHTQTNPMLYGGQMDFDWTRGNSPHRLAASGQEYPIHSQGFVGTNNGFEPHHLAHPSLRSHQDKDMGIPSPPPRAVHFPAFDHSMTSANSFLDNGLTSLQDQMPPQSPLLQEQMSPNCTLMHTPFFDPRTPPPSVPHQRQLSSEAASQESSSPREGKTPEVLDLLQSNIKLDLGTSIGHQQYSEVDTSPGATEDGRKLYESALKQWYNQESSLTRESAGLLSSAESVSKEKESTKEAKETLTTEYSKPSYSDIAKMPKSTVGQLQAPLKTEASALESWMRFQGKKSSSKRDGKPMRPHVKRTSSGSKFFSRGSLGGDSDSRVSPNSKYGLDSFDDLVNTGNHSSSVENLLHATRSRRGSGSSVGSGHLEESSAGVSSHTSFSETDILTQKKNLKESSSTSKPSAEKKACPKSGDHMFFDPRRIFQSKNTNKSRAVPPNNSPPTRVRGDSRSTDDGNATVILNNGKPTAGHGSSRLSNSGQHDYINNDLRDGRKLTNQTAAENHGHHGKRESSSRSGTGRKSTGRANNGVYRRDRRRSPDSSKEDQRHEQQTHQHRLGYWDTDKLEEWWCLAMDKGKEWGNIIFTTVFSLLIYFLGLVLYIVVGGVHLLLLLIAKVWSLLKEKVFKGCSKGSRWTMKDYLRRRVGLEENIELPSTGEEAMKRLLACKGKDPYSILGLRADSSDDDIKKYYRKQAVLVHPDKNQEPGAEEAFKILGHAFEMIGDPSKRKQYDSHTQEASEAEQMREFAEMLSKLQTKIQEAANIMRCDNCGGQHKRVPMDRPFYSARFCQRCNIYHSAKEGDVWAESSMLGFYWHYYALMEGHVYDITEWIKCHKEFFKHMQANTHAVLYRIAADGNRRQRHHQANEGNLEDLINRLFSRSAAGGGDSSWSPPGTDPGDWAQGGQATGSSGQGTASSKKGRRKKRR